MLIVILRKWIGKKIPIKVLDFYFGKKFRAEQRIKWTTSPKEYWTLHTVQKTKDELTTRESSRAYFDWRCSRYPGYLELMPVSGHSDQRVLDYGCGPGHDLVGFLEFSNPALLVGADVSTTAIDLAKKRVRLHPGGQSTMIVQTSDLGEIQFSENKKIEFDYIHCSGVLHHVSEPVEVLLSFKRVLAPGGRIRLMVYNRDSIWRNFYVPYVLQHRRKAIDSNLNLDEAFRMSTDGPDCPISRSYDTDSMTALAAIAGLNCKKIGTAFSQFELNIWETYKKIALADNKLPTQVHNFTSKLRIDADGMPIDINGDRPGIDLVFELTHEY